MNIPPDLLDSSSITDEGGEDHVDTLLHAEEEVHLVLLGHGRQVRVGSGQVATLLGSKVAAILDLTNDVVRSFKFYKKL
jgi:hypothetical protein